jgi:dTDP-4-amino-4,6-dideoxygalactose transaminase
VAPIEHTFIRRTDSVRQALQRLDQAGTGLLLLLQENGQFERTVTDGDLRRLLLTHASLDTGLESLAHINSIVLQEGYTRQSALSLMNAHDIDHLPLLSRSGQVLQLIQRRDIDEQILLSTPHLSEHERQYVDEAFSTNWIAPLGPNVDAFEAELAQWVGVGHAAALSSGTAAIHLSLVLLGVASGDVVFCSALTFAATANPIVYQGAQPVFIDSEPESWNMSPLALEHALSAAKKNGRLPKAVVVVNLYGQSADIDPLLALCNAYGVPLIEDAAESLGATYKGRASGTFGLMGIYSFNGNKIITTSGGGMLVSGDESLIKRARYLATQAREPAPHYEHTVVGYNYRMSNILAGVGRGQLRVLADRVHARRRIFERYQQGLGHLNALQWMPEPAWSFSNHWLSTCTLNPQCTHAVAADVMHHLAAERIEARPVWKPMQLQPVFKNALYFSHGSTSVSEQLFEHGLCLPSGSNMTESQQDRVIAAVEKAVS